MTVLLFCFLLGCVAGLRSLTAPALVCWAAHLGWLHLSGTRLAFIGRPWTLIFITLLAVVELIADKLPRTPARTAPVGLFARIVLGGASALALAISAGTSLPLTAIVGVIGALVGTFAGYNIRRTLTSQGRLPDFAVALAEDTIAIVGGLLIVSRF
jgi:uncharacterized membrane protein